jgi:pimeloyl-ACP methyl ester carboxylesterase
MALDNTISIRAQFIAKQPRPSFVCDDAKAIALPVLLTTGERSPPIFKRIVAELERCLPQARRQTIAGASHTVPAEQPALFAEAVTAFFAQH